MGINPRHHPTTSQNQQQRLQDNAKRKTSSSSSWLLNLLGFPGKLLGPGQNQARECVRLKKNVGVVPLLSVSPEIAASLVGKLLLVLPRAESWWGGGIWWSKVRLSIYFGDASSRRMAGLVFLSFFCEEAAFYLSSNRRTHPGSSNSSESRYSVRDSFVFLR